MKAAPILLLLGGSLVLAGCESYRGGTVEEQEYNTNTGYSVTQTPRTAPRNPGSPEMQVYPNSPPPPTTPP